MEIFILVSSFCIVKKIFFDWEVLVFIERLFLEFIFGFSIVKGFEIVEGYSFFLSVIWREYLVFFEFDLGWRCFFLVKLLGFGNFLF